MRSMTFAAVVLMAAIGAEISQPALAGAGELDPTFGISGRVVLPAGPTTNGYAYANALLVQPDARIVMAGYNYPDGSSVYRLMPNGDLDVTFGAGGRRDPGINGVFGLVLQPDGKFVVGGSAYAGSAEGFGLVRLSADGTVDTSFGSNGTGIVSSAFGSGGAYARKLLLQSDGKVIAIGFTNAGSSATFNAIALARYLPDGSLDTTFGAGGQQTYNVDSGTYIYPNDAALQSDGKIVIAGSRSGTVYSPVLLRYTNACQIDPGFSSTAPGTLGFSILDGLVVQDDGKLALAGGGASANDGRQARLNADGTPDSAYGTAGVTVIPPSGEISNRGLDPATRREGSFAVGQWFRGFAATDHAAHNGGYAGRQFWRRRRCGRTDGEPDQSAVTGLATRREDSGGRPSQHRYRCGYRLRRPLRALALPGRRDRRHDRRVLQYHPGPLLHHRERSRTGVDRRRRLGTRLDTHRL
ncbi:MAG: hypothetical protein IPI73_17630 [Betaproteobacteria bacterium]|nr:hypothetical protein [Betaproteobacteria bacterium]